MLKDNIHRLARWFGFEFYKLANFRPSLHGLERVTGSFAPLDSHRNLGTPETYFIHSGYTARIDNDFFDDTGNRDQWQQEVYRYAAELCQQLNFKTVCDVGCGSAYKLLKYLGHLDVIGVDMPETVQLLRERHPERAWQSGFDEVPSQAIDLVIAADVIEHLPNPDEMMRFIARIGPRHILISTPDRDLFRAGTYNGPPGNPAHVREWNFTELEAYVSSYFELDEHFISSAPQCTQCILCHPRTR